MSHVTTISRCRLCGGMDLEEVLDLGRQALSGRFVLPDEPDPLCAPLVLVRCGGCGLVQLRHSVEGGELYTDTYGYRSGINATMRAHLRDLARDVAARAGLVPGDVALDVGCNDGTLLGSYPVPGLSRHGIDPLAEKFRQYYAPDMRVACGYFGSQTRDRVLGGARARALTSIAMFYDLEDPGQFVADVAATLAPDGVWVLEQSYLPSMLERNSFDTVCHEHLEYYALAQIERMAREHDLRVFDVLTNDVNGGSFRLYVCPRDAPYPANDAALEGMRSDEARLGLGTEEPYRRFRERIETLRTGMRDFVERERARGRRFYAYGASTKGNTLLQYYGLDHTHIVAAADRNPAKWGRQTPATRIPIVSEDQARAERPDYFLVLPWHFREEFLQREQAFLGQGGRFIFPLPTMEIV